MKQITELPPGDWTIVLWGSGCIIAVCPEHEPRLIDTETGVITIINPNRLSFIAEYKE